MGQLTLVTFVSFISDQSCWNYRWKSQV